MARCGFCTRQVRLHWSSGGPGPVTSWPGVGGRVGKARQLWQVFLDLNLMHFPVFIYKDTSIVLLQQRAGSDRGGDEGGGGVLRGGYRISERGGGSA